MRMEASAQAQFLAHTGMQPMPIATGFQILERSLAGPEPVVLAAIGDRRRIHAYLGVHSAAVHSQPATSVADVVRHEVAALLSLHPDSLRPDLTLQEHGADSILLKELAATLSRRLQLSVSPQDFFTHNTVNALIDHLTPRANAQPMPAQPIAPAADEPIAIIGAAVRLPGAETLDAFWRNLEQAADLVTPIPAPRERLCGRFPFTHGAFLDNVDRFDAAFFQIGPREAELMDPQHRLFLETAWHALEDAAIRPLSLGGKAVGIFAGIQSMDYALRVAGCSDPQLVPGTAHATLPNRLSYLLDWQGPSEAIDTACSSSLVAVHRAVESLRRGECETALAGGVNLILSPGAARAIHQMGVLSPQGRCRVFGAGADGYVRGEGVGVVVLKPLSQALRDGDPVRAVIRGSGVAHGGRASSLTAPSAASQARLLSRVWKQAGVAPSSISYLEAHGTGTELGDPVEYDGIRQAFEQSGQPATCSIGSLKSNLGHLEPASGIAGIVKVMLAIEHGQLPATLHAAELNPHLRTAGSPLRIQHQTQPWPASPRRAGVSSFGFGGVNAHVLLEQAPEANRESKPGPWVFPLSARSASALRAAAQSMLAIDADPAAVAATLQHGRESFAHRLAVVAASLAECKQALGQWLAGRQPANAFHHISPARSFREAAAQPRRPADGSPLDLAKRWAHGEDIAWAPAGPRINLPGYPFEGQSYWYRPQAAADWRLEQHRVGDTPTLPASAILEAVFASRPEVQSLRSVEWLAPARALPLDLRWNGEQWQAYDQGRLAARGSASAREPLTAVDWTQIRERCNQPQSLDALYQALESAALHHGDAYRLLHSANTGRDEAYATLRATQQPAGWWHPAIADSAQQLMALLMHEGELQVPRQLDAVERYGDLALAHQVWVRRNSQAFDLYLADADGNLLGAMRGFRAARALPIACHRAAWRPAPLQAPSATAPIVVVRHFADAGLTQQLKQLAPVQEIVIGQAFRVLSDTACEVDPQSSASWTRALARCAGPARYLFLAAMPPAELDAEALTPQALAVTNALLGLLRALAAAGQLDRIHLTAVTAHGSLSSAGLAALCRSAQSEYPAAALQTVELVGDAAAQLLLSEPRTGPAELLYNNAGRRERYWQPITLADSANPIALRHRGVCVIVGGAQGVGLAAALHLARTRQARLALIGRSPSATCLDQIAAAGGEAIYLQADCALSPTVRLRYLPRVRFAASRPILWRFLSSSSTPSRPSPSAATRPRSAGSIRRGTPPGCRPSPPR